MPFIVIFVIGMAAIAATIALVVAAERRRARLLKVAGTTLGFRTFEKGEHLAIPSVEIMRMRRRTVGAAMEGTWQGENVMVFDLSYPAGKNVSRTTIFLLRLSARETRADKRSAAMARRSSRCGKGIRAILLITASGISESLLRASYPSARSGNRAIDPCRQN